MSGLDRLCEAVCWVSSPDDRSERFRGQCDAQARYIRDGHAVCGRHRQAKDPEYVQPVMFKRAWWGP